MLNAQTKTKYQLVKKTGDNCTIAVNIYDVSGQQLQQSDTVQMTFNEYAQKLQEQVKVEHAQKKTTTSTTSIATKTIKKKQHTKTVQNYQQMYETLRKTNNYIYKTHRIPAIIATSVGAGALFSGSILAIMGAINNNHINNPTYSIAGYSLLASGAVCVAAGTWGLVYSKKLKTKHDLELQLYTNGLSIKF